MKKILLIVSMILINMFSYAKLRVGVTLQPYYSFVSNIVGDKMEVVPAIRGDIYDVHNYKARPEDIKKMATLNILVVNGIGHDEFIYGIVRSARMGGKIKIINANKGVSLMPVSGMRTKTRVMNPHSFISITSSIQQIYTIARELGQIDPANKAYYNKNAQAYAQKLRNMKAAAITKVNHLKNLNMRVATSHAGYDYLLSEFGLRVRAVIEPAHGVEPSASDIKAIIDTIKRDKIDVVFVDAQAPNKYSTTIQKATGVRIRSLSHMSRGAYTKDGFERFMKYNLDSLTSAMLEVGKTRGR
ncbi:metal ABC transporter solute-binding protein, Zn/Mn family [Leptotrichia sp. oral taxon 212]|jgi:manganese-binding protein|uniref:metal ABC transporter solute-binding protein, Zn/Mn family n=1 Tax=Leptotrichia sp. oral taxon 212 TaxID=712357 RepID=UPI0006A9AC88|nr:zinc ABC transporter substrate-binding protein [Leptotrichia sp. oral taxon 212]ALA95311.1 ABC transporter substrate-binding protein [Leptotrichia sp. oral taxon 212]